MSDKGKSATDVENTTSPVTQQTFPAEHPGVSKVSEPVYADDKNKGVDARGDAPPSVWQSFSAKMKHIAGTVVPYGGLASSVFNLCSVCIGAGFLGLPAAANRSGLVMAMLYLVIMALMTVFSLHILSLVMEKTGLRTFEHTARGVMGGRFVYFVIAIRLLNSFGTSTSYIITIGHVLRPIIENSCGAPEFLRTPGGIRLLTALTWMVFMLPLILPKRVNSLRYVSGFAIIFVLYFALTIVIHGAQSGLPKLTSDEEDGVKLFNSGNSAIASVGVFMFAYVCQINIYEVYWEMKKRSCARFTLYAAISMAFCGTFYGFVAFFGYGEFGGTVTNSILLMYNPITEVMMLIGSIGVVVKICISYALQTMAIRNSIYHVLGWELETLPYWKHFSFVIPLSLTVLLAGLFIPNINTVFGIVGAICGGFLSAIFPSLFYMYSGKWTRRNVGNFHFFGTYALFILGVVGLVFGTVTVVTNTIMSFIHGGGGAAAIKPPPVC
ncbi:amino acid transporter, putative [Trypanosoma brucei gambiense DAL972]|uniref:Amino acid transporter, putative n=1 Tax=Trypanosoma brucei gambiense (strain MHOM/CI/86/DAL972) TaxID=679716 RepID=D0AAG8_TRYB9|nr:amino acid transporter, putative [Trypanosoma brucei gambiense DAL972]CBH18669.1 amino acid transporter, putative [Trypanosoma brucei gambiense DAL972]|eukprot:XP_011780933.1 amino acid transporter, putative [Trypanosoma brucei gambiense DAL972]